MPATTVRRASPTPHLGRVGELALVAHELTNSAIPQFQIQSFELAHPSMYSIHELLEHEKASPAEPKLQDLCDTGHKRISERCPSEDPVLLL